MNLTDALNRLTTIRALLLGFMMAAIYYFVVFDGGGSYAAQISTLQGQIKEMQTKINAAHAKVERANVYKQAASELGGKIQQMMSVIPESFNVSDLMSIVSKEVETVGSSLINIAPQPARPSLVAPEFEEFMVTINVDGSFNQHMMLLSNLTKVNQILVTRKFELSLNGQPVPGVPPLVKLMATVVAYRYKGKEAI